MVLFEPIDAPDVLGRLDRRTSGAFLLDTVAKGESEMRMQASKSVEARNCPQAAQTFLGLISFEFCDKM